MQFSGFKEFKFSLKDFSTPSLEEVVSKDNHEQSETDVEDHDKHLERYQIRQKWDKRCV